MTAHRAPPARSISALGSTRPVAGQMGVDHPPPRPQRRPGALPQRHDTRKRCLRGSVVTRFC
jgi:hypothetical protein